MVKWWLRPVLALMCSLVLLAGCAAPRFNRFTNEERAALKTLVCIPNRVSIHEHNELLMVTETYAGKTVSLIGSGGEEMSVSTYKARTALAVKAVTDCLSVTCGDSAYAANRYKESMSELIAQNANASNGPLRIMFISEVEQNQFLGLSRREKAEFIKNHNADAALILGAYHLAGLHTKILYGSYGAGYTGLYAKIDDYQSEDEIYHSGVIFTKHIPVAQEEFCENFVGAFENAINIHAARWYKEIMGVK